MEGACGVQRFCPVCPPPPRASGSHWGKRVSARLQDTRAPPRAGSPFTGWGAWTLSGQEQQTRSRNSYALPGALPTSRLPPAAGVRQSFCAQAHPCLDPSAPLAPSHDLSRPRAQQGPSGPIPCIPMPHRRPCSSAVCINLGPRGLPSDLLSPGFQRPLHPLIFSQIPDKKA